jgi:hypothetical protein
LQAYGEIKLSSQREWKFQDRFAEMLGVLGCSSLSFQSFKINLSCFIFVGFPSFGEDVFRSNSFVSYFSRYQPND